MSGALAGLSAAVVINPLELYKVRKQVAKKNIYRISGNNCIEKKIHNNKKFYKID